MEVESRGEGMTDSQAETWGEGGGGEDGQKTSPVRQGCAVKKVTELSVFNLGR